MKITIPEITVTFHHVHIETSEQDEVVVNVENVLSEARSAAAAYVDKLLQQADIKYNTEKMIGGNLES